MNLDHTAAAVLELQRDALRQAVTSERLRRRAELGWLSTPRLTNSYLGLVYRRNGNGSPTGQ